MTTLLVDHEKKDYIDLYAERKAPWLLKSWDGCFGSSVSDAGDPAALTSPASRPPSSSSSPSTRKARKKDAAADVEELLGEGVGKMRLKDSEFDFRPVKSRFTGRPVTEKFEGWSTEVRG